MAEKRPHIKILLVDDREDNLLSIETLLEKDGYTFYRALSGKEALKILLKELDFSLILMDVQMPEINGFETASLIYQREKLRDIPIIFITAFSFGEENVFKGYESGAVDYIYKPINPQLLKVKVSIFVELYQKNFLLKQQEKKLIRINSELQKEINDRIRAENEIKIKNLQLNEAQKMSSLGSWEWDPSSGSVKGSDEFINMHEFIRNKKEISFEIFKNKVLPEDMGLFNDSLSYMLKELVPIDFIYRIIDYQGKIKSINLKARPVADKEINSIKVLGTSQDITKIKQTEEQLLIFYILEKSLNEIYIIDAATLRFQYVNDDARRNLGYEKQDILSMSLFDILPVINAEDFRKLSSSIMDNNEKIVFKTFHKRKDDSLYPVETHLQVIEKMNRKVFLAIVIDITEREKVEEKIQASLKEKELLLKEIYHRVKNNLQVISSLLNLQSGYIKDENIRSIFVESRNRILSMALVHEKLYKYNDLSNIDFCEYINDLSANLISTYRGKNQISFDLEREHDVLLDIDKSIPLGLIINELLTNSLKHAFIDGRKGIIKISLRNSNKNLIISLSDNGIGMKTEIDIKSLPSLGMQLIFSLVEQLSGTLELSRNCGTEFKITIPYSQDTVFIPANSEQYSVQKC